MADRGPSLCAKYRPFTWSKSPKQESRGACASGLCGPTHSERAYLARKIIFRSPVQEESASIQVFSEMGQLVLSQKLQSESQTLELNNLQSGIYFIQIVGNNNTTVHRIIKK